jgi:hypothetical protein
MRLEEKQVKKYGNSKVVLAATFEEGEKVYILDAEMLEMIKQNGKQNGKQS